MSEPLGVVPENFWGSFPQYDNPGLFSEDTMRSGIMTAEWPLLGFREKRILPFDPNAYRLAIHELGNVIGKFIRANSKKNFISFVEDFDGKSTHSDMLDSADDFLGREIDLSRRFTKREAPRTSPKEHILKTLRAIPF